jgi:hypothetical protein
VLLHTGSDFGVSLIEADSRAHAQPRNNLGSVVVATGTGAAESILAQRVVDAQSYADADGRAICIEREKPPPLLLLLLLLRLQFRNRCLRGDEATVQLANTGQKNTVNVGSCYGI